jgi:hypothetical protein
VTRTPWDTSTSSIQPSSSAEQATVLCRVGQQSLAQRDRLGQVDAQPANTAVVDPPELGLETLAESDDRAVRVGAEKAQDGVVEAAGPERLRLTEAAPEPLLEGVVDQIDELDRLRVVDDRIGPERLHGPLVERPEQRLGQVAELDPDLLRNHQGSNLAVVRRAPRRACAGSLTSARAKRTHRDLSLPVVSCTSCSGRGTASVEPGVTDSA